MKHNKKVRTEHQMNHTRDENKCNRLAYLLNSNHKISLKILIVLFFQKFLITTIFKKLKIT